MLKIIVCSFLLAISFSVMSEEGHDDHKGHGKPAAEKEIKKESHDEHSDHDEHEEHEEKTDGFKLNQSATKTFEIKTIDYVPQKTLISKDAIYKGLNEVNLYRVRGDLYKRIDFKINSQTSSGISISSADLAQGDKIVVHGVGFLRMAEIAASGGLSDSHSH